MTTTAIGLFLYTSNTIHAADRVIAQTDGAEIEFWQSIKGSSDPQEFEAYLQAYPNGKFALLARLRLKKLQSSQEGATEPRVPTKPKDVSGYSALGAHQAAKAAAKQSDFETAARFYQRVLIHDPNNKEILAKAFIAELISGNMTQAFSHAQKLVALDPRHTMANIALGVEAFRTDNFRSAKQHFDNAASTPFGKLTATIANAWVLAARRKFHSAVNALPTDQGDQQTASHYMHHRALISSLAGKHKSARAEFRQLFSKEPGSSSHALAYARHQSSIGNNNLARTIIEKHLNAATTESPVLLALRTDIDAGKNARPPVAKPIDGLAALFELFGYALVGQRYIELGLIHFQLALHLKSNADAIKYEIGAAWSTLKNHESAKSAFERVARSSPVWVRARIEVATALYNLSRADEAISILQAMAVDHPSEYRLHEVLGFVLRNKSRFSEAADAYTRAINLIEEPKKGHWKLFFHRGISYERSNEWSRSETDLRRALKLNSEQPLVLNYLGYSLIDRGLKPAEALHLIKRAVELKPDDGYIVDSLGYAHYKLKDYQTAVRHLERAANLVSDDPTILSHLGDAYWQTGQKEKAQQIWSKALEVKPETRLQTSLKKKIREGLSPADNDASSSSDDDDLDDLETLE